MTKCKDASRWDGASGGALSTFLKKTGEIKEPFKEGIALFLCMQHQLFATGHRCIKAVPTQLQHRHREREQEGGGVKVTGITPQSAPHTKAWPLASCNSVQVSPFGTTE